MTRRLDRVNGLLREEISTLVAQELKDPRLPLLLSITQVDTSPDLHHAKVFVSVLGSPQEKKGALSGLSSAAGFLRRELRQRVSLRDIPQLHFLLDDSIQRGQELLSVIDRLSSQSEPPAEAAP